MVMGVRENVSLWALALSVGLHLPKTVTMQRDTIGLSSGVGNITEDSCEGHSQYFNREKNSELSCDTLNYTKQQCMLKDNRTWDCLKERALMHDQASCDCYNMVYCSYVEMCVFADDNFKCDTGYKCVPTNEGGIKCTGDGLTPVTPECIPSLLHCPKEDTTDCQYSDRPLLFFERIFKKHCLAQYEDEFGKHKVWYYLEQRHFSNTSYGYSKEYSIRPISPDVDVSDLCKPNDEWKYAITTVAIFILVVISVYGGWRYKRYQALQYKIWNATVRQCVESRYKFIFDAPPLPEVVYEAECHDEIIPGLFSTISSRNRENGNHSKCPREYARTEHRYEEKPQKKVTQGSSITCSPTSMILENATYTGLLSNEGSSPFICTGSALQSTNNIPTNSNAECLPEALSLSPKAAYVNEPLLVPNSNDGYALKSLSPLPRVTDTHAFEETHSTTTGATLNPRSGASTISYTNSNDGYTLKSSFPSPRVTDTHAFVETHSTTIGPTLNPRSDASMISYVNLASGEIPPSSIVPFVNESILGSNSNDGYAMKSFLNKPEGNGSEECASRISANMDNPAYQTSMNCDIDKYY